MSVNIHMKRIYFREPNKLWNKIVWHIYAIQLSKQVTSEIMCQWSGSVISESAKTVPRPVVIHLTLNLFEIHKNPDIFRGKAFESVCKFRYLAQGPNIRCKTPKIGILHQDLAPGSHYRHFAGNIFYASPLMTSNTYPQGLSVNTI